MKSILSHCRVLVLVATTLLGTRTLGQLDPGCVVTIMNRSATVGPDGFFFIPNIPVEPGLFRVRAYCTRNGMTLGGQSAYVRLLPNGITAIQGLTLGELDPIPVSISIHAPKLTFTGRNETAQFTAAVTLPDATTRDASTESAGTLWSSSNPQIASVDAAGTVIALRRGQAIIQVRNEGVQAAVTVSVLIPDDTDGDGMPDPWERLYGLNLADASDRAQDIDRDGLNSLEEFERGTNPQVADTDGDGIPDGEEVRLATGPTRADTDGDGLSDGQEVSRGTNPLLVDSDGDGLSDRTELDLGLNPGVSDATTTVQGRVLDKDGNAAGGVAVIVFRNLIARTDADGAFAIEKVPAEQGDLVVTAQLIRGGRTQEGQSATTPPVPGGTTAMGTIQLQANVGLVSGTITDPLGTAVPNAQITLVQGELEVKIQADGTGQYRFPNMSAGVVTVKARDYRTGLRGSAVGTLPNDDSVVINVRLSALGSLAGTVFDRPTPNNPPVPVGAGVEVVLNSSGGRQTTVTDGLGRYRFEYVTPGSFTVDVSDAAGNRGQSTGNLPGTGRTVVADVTYLGRGVVNGVVLTAAGNPAANATVRLQSSSVFGGSQAAGTGEGNSFGFQNVFVGDFSVLAFAAESRLAGSATGRIERDGQSVSVEITLSTAGNIAGKVFHADGVTPAPGVQVQLQPTGLSTMTDGDGNYGFTLIPVGSYVVTAREAASGDIGQAGGVISVQDQTVPINVTLRGFGEVWVEVRDGAGDPAAGARVNLFHSDFGGNRSGTSGPDGRLKFEHILAGGVSVSASDGTYGLSGSASGSVTSGGSTTIRVNLQQSGSIAGRVVGSDGSTPVAGVRVNLGGAAGRSVTSDGQGAFAFQGLPLGTYALTIYDGAGNLRAHVPGLELVNQGQSLERTLVMSGVGTVRGRVSLAESGGPLAGVPMIIQSQASGAGGGRYAYTDVDGNYQLALVPEGPFQVSLSTRVGNNVYTGSATSEIPSPNATVVVDIVATMIFDPNPIALHDANDFLYDVDGDGTLATGSVSAFVPGAVGRGAANLDILLGDEVYRFRGESYGTFEEGNREVVVRHTDLAGLDVVRKVYVPRDGYFARHLDFLTNPRNEPVTVGVRLTSYYRFISKVQGGFRFNREPRIVSSSNGNGSAEAGDRWLILDDDEDLDPFLQTQLPSIAMVFDGPDAPLAAGRVEFSLDFNRNVGQLVEEWSTITIAPRETVGLLTFVAQQVGRLSAQSVADRLVQLPPEALTGISAAEAASVRNFQVPSDGSSPLGSLPSLVGTVSGRVFVGDGSMGVPFADVWFRGSHPIFGRTYFSRADGNGAFGWVGNVPGNGNSTALAIAGFTLWSRDPVTGLVSPTAFGSFPSGLLAAEQDVIFANAGLLSGTVRRVSGEVITSGQVSASGGGLFNPVSTSPGSTGRYLFRVIPPGDYTVAASVPNPGGTPLGAAVGATVEAGESTEVDIVFAGTGGVMGIVFSGAGDPAVSIPVRLTQGGGFQRLAQTGTGGQFSFLDIPVGQYSLSATDPLTGIPVGATVEVSADSITLQDLTLVGRGTVIVRAEYSTGGAAAGAQVQIRESAKGSGYRSAGTANAQGQLRIDNVAVGEFVVRVYHPGNSTLYTEAPGTVGAAEAVVEVPVLVPVDRAPTISLVSPTANAQYLEGSSIVLAVSTSDDQGVQYVEYFLDGERVVRRFDNPFSSSFTLPLVDADRDIILTAMAQDTGPNRTTSSPVAVRILNDVLPPNITVLSPVGGASFREGATLNVQAQASDNLGLQRVEFRANGELFASDPNSPFSWSYTISAEFVQGSSTPLTFQCTAVDLSGLTTSVEVTVNVVDDDPPTVAIVSPLEGASVVEGSMISVTAQASDDVGVSRVEFYVDGTKVGADISSPYTTTFRVPGGSDGGSVIVGAVVTDTLGQTATTGVTVLRLGDAEPPLVSLVSPADGATLPIGDSDVVLVFDASDATLAGSGIDLDGDGTAESVFQVEIAVARELLRLLRSAGTHVGLVRWNQAGELRQALTSDVGQVEEALRGIESAGPSGAFGRNIAEGMRIASDELAGPRSRRNAAPMQLLISYGYFNSYPTEQTTRAQDAGVCVNSFAVGAGARTSDLNSIAVQTRCTLSVVGTREQWNLLRDRNILFGVNQLPVLASASDTIAVRQVDFRARTASGSYDQTISDMTAPYTALFGLPDRTTSLDLILGARAYDFGDNSADAPEIHVTILPTMNAPRIVRLDPSIAAYGETVRLTGRYYDPVPGNNRVTFGNTEAYVTGGDKFSLFVTVPTGIDDSSIVVTSEGRASNPVSFRLLRTGVVRARVTFADGTPVSGVPVEISDSTTGGGFRNVGLTDVDGRLDIEDVRGSFTVRVAHPNNSALTAAFSGNVSSDGQAVVANLVLPPTATVRGRVDFADGTPASSATVLLRMTGFANRSVATPTGGGFEFTTVPANAFFEIEVSHPSGEIGSVSGRATAHGEILERNVTMIAAVQIADAVQAEGNAGLTDMNFTVRLSSAPLVTVRVDYVTSIYDLAVPGVDYQNASGTLVFDPGVSERVIRVPIVGDVVNEPDEFFQVRLNNAVNCRIVDSAGVGTIQNDDPLPRLTIGNATVTEGNVGTVQAVVTLRLSAAGGQTGQITYTTVDGTANAPADYTSLTGSITFAPGETEKTLTLSVVGETQVEPDEKFFVNLTGSSNVDVDDNQAEVIILDDDGAAREIHHFEFAAIASPQHVGEPFTVTVTAKDAFGNTVTTFDHPLALKARNARLNTDFNLLAFWDFNSADSSVAIDRVGGYSGLLANGAVPTSGGGGWTGGGADRAMDFGTTGNRYVFVNGATFLNQASARNQVTFSFWQKLVQVSSASSFWAVSPSSTSSSRGAQAHVPWSDNWIYFDTAGCCGSGQRVTASITSYPGYSGSLAWWNDWHHFVFVKDGNSKTIYIDGSVFLQGVNASALPSDFNALYIGSQIGGSGSIRGWIDDFAVFGAALDAESVEAIRSGIAPDRLGTVIEGMYSPTTLTGFVNGVFTGDVTVAVPVEELVLEVDDGDGHKGSANPISVELRNDLSVTMEGSVDPIPAGGEITYTIKVRNEGPTTSTQVTAIDELPSGVLLVSASASQGTVVVDSGVVTMNLGDLVDGAEATVLLTMRVNQDGAIRNRVFVTRSEAENYLANNSVESTTGIAPFHSFRVESLHITGVQTANYQGVLGSEANDLGGLAASDQSLIFTGSSRSGVFKLGQFDAAIATSVRRNALVSDLRSGLVWQLGSGGRALTQPAGGVVTQLLPVDSASGASLFGAVVRDFWSQSVFTPSAIPLGTQPAISERANELGFSDLVLPTGNSIRMRTLLQPTISGDYTFWVSGDRTELWLSTDEDVAHAERIASGPEWSGVADWNSTASQKSSPRYLEAGRSYYLQVLKIRDYNGAVGVGWSKPMQSADSPSETLPISVLGPQAVEGLEDRQPITLSRAINVGSGSGVFAGYGSVVLHNGRQLFHVDMSSGLVRDLGPMTMPARRSSNSGWFWGIAENTGDQISLVYVRDAQTIVRTRVPDGSTTVLSTFSNLGDAAMITAVPKWNKWAFVAENVTQFHPQSYPIGTADASYTIEGTRGDDLIVSVLSDALPAPIDIETVFTISVANTGSTTASSVRLTDQMAGSFVLHSAETSQGACSEQNGVVDCALGDIGGGESVTVQLRYTPTAPGQVEHLVLGSRAERDFYLPNNQVRCPITVILPEIAAADVNFSEQNEGRNELVFQAQLSSPRSVPVSVNFSTQSQTAQGFGVDFENAVGTLVFSPGETSKEIRVPVVGDAFYELDETFILQFSNPSGVRILDAQAIATISNDDSRPVLTVRTSGVDEGNVQSRVMVFEFSLSAPSGLTSQTTYTTSDSTALANSDYLATSGVVTIPAGDTLRTVPVTVLGDINPETDESLLLNLSSPSNVDLAANQVIGLIRDDDSQPGRLHHFVVDPIASPKFVGEPFTLGVAAVDASGSPVLDYAGHPSFTLRDPDVASRVILGNIAHQYGPFNDSYTLGLRFTPNTDIRITHFRNYFGVRASIWSEDGSLLITQPLTVPNGTWTETALTAPVVLSAGRTYIYGVYSGPSGAYYYRQTSQFDFLDGVVHGYAYSSGDAFPASWSTGYHYMTDFRYEVGGNHDVPFAPTVTGDFVNGRWSGAFTVLAPIPGAIIALSDGDGHSGVANLIELQLRNDLSVSVSAADQSPEVGEEVALTLTIANEGPSVSTGVSGTMSVSPYLVITGTSTTMGTASVDGNQASVDVGDLAAGEQAILTVNARVHGDGVIEVAGSAQRSESEAYLGNNHDSTDLKVPLIDGFRVEELSATGSRILDANSITGDDRSAIAVSETQVFYTGDSATGRFPIDLIGGSGVTLGAVLDSLVTDLKTHKVYSLGNGTTLLGNGGPVTSLIELNGDLGTITDNQVVLSQPISLGFGSGLFSGFGRIVVHDSNGAFHEIEIASGKVTPLGSMAIPLHRGSEGWAYWGIAEKFDGGSSIIYVRDATTISRTRVPTGETTVVGAFSNLGDAAAITARPDLGRWYFHYEGSGQFGGGSEVVGFADGRFSWSTVTLRDDLSVKISASTSEVQVGGSVVYEITVSHVGPSAATGVVLTDLIGSGGTVSAATTSRGVISWEGDRVTAEIGDLGADASAVVTVTVSGMVEGTLLNTAEVERSGVDFYFPNNRREHRVNVIDAPLELFVFGVTAEEGDAGESRIAFLEVILSRPIQEPFQVNFSTSPGTASEGVDYIATSGQIEIPPGETSVGVEIMILGDDDVEGSEEFYLYVSDNAGERQSSAIVYISDDEVIEGDVNRGPGKEGRRGLAGRRTDEVKVSELEVDRVELVQHQLRLGFATQMGARYRVERALDVRGTWELVGTIQGSGGRESWTDPDSTRGAAFYRVVRE